MTIYMFIGMIAGAIFGGSAWVATSAYFVGMAAIIISGIMLKKTKTVSNEKDMLKVGYGAMVLESLLAVLALCVAGAAAAADGTPAAGTPFQVFSSGVAGFFEMFGIPVYIAQCFMTMCVSALALTSLDAVARI